MASTAFLVHSKEELTVAISHARPRVNPVQPSALTAKPNRFSKKTKLPTFDGTGKVLCTIELLKQRK